MAGLFFNRLSGTNLQVPEQDDAPSKMSASFRDGKFRTLSEFLQVDDTDTSLHHGYKAIGVTNVRPGFIVHISDPKSRLDRRVMLVLRKSSMSFMCLTFCSHWPPPDPRDHWRVCDKGKAKDQSQDPKFEALEVALQPFGHSSPKVPPQVGVTINVQDVWNVENEVNVKVLGEAVQGSLQMMVKAVKELFCRNLDEVVPPPAEEVEQKQERKNSQISNLKEAKVFVRTGSGRRHRRVS